MTYRDDHEAALMRAQNAERERAQIAAENVRLEHELATAREWLGGPRKRAMMFGGIATASVTLFVVGLLVGRATAPSTAPAPLPKREYLPTIAGVLVADGPKVGHWTLNATRCAPRDDGIELTAVGSTDHHVWLTSQSIEIETPSGDFFLEQAQCFAKFSHVVNRNDDGRYEGFVELDCHFDDNRLQGRIDFKHCR